MPSQSATDVAGRDSALLSLTEVGLGSALHAARVPLKGQFLSLNQGFLLSYSVKCAREDRRARILGAWVSSIAALLKSLSPAGPKLTPMLAISMQGLLHTLGTLLLGANVAGAILGSLLGAAWALVQPWLVSWLLLGSAFVNAVYHYAESLSRPLGWRPEELVWILVGVYAAKAVCAVCLAFLAFRLPEWRVESYFRSVSSRTRVIRPRLPTSSPWRGALRDIASPIFLFSLALTLVFLFFAESSTGTIFWALLRPIALGFVGFYLVRITNWQKVLAWMGERFGPEYAASLQTALDRVRSW